MRLLIALIIGICLFFSGFISCVSDPVSGGSGTETINTFVCFSDGEPARGASVSIIDANGWIDSVQKNVSPVLTRTVTDSNGYLTVNIPKKKVLNVQIDHSDQGIFLADIYSVSMLDYTIKLKEYGSYRTYFKEKQHQISRLKLSGSDYSTSIGSEGDFLSQKISTGLFSVIGLKEDESLSGIITMCGAVSLSNGEVKIDSLLNPLQDRLIIDNFEGKFGLTIPGLVYPEIYWYAVSDFGLFFWSNVFNIWKWKTHEYPLGKSYISLKPVKEENDGTSMKFTAVLDDMSAYSYSIAGISFRGFSGDQYADLSGMKEFSLTAKGNGTIWIRFETKELKYATNSMSHYTYPIKLNDTSTIYKVPVDSLEILPGGISKELYPWDRVAAKVLQIEFEFYPSENHSGDTLELILDDFYLDGVNLNSFLK